MRFAIYVAVMRFIRWFNFDECYKESMGYTCRHRLMSNGRKECGND